MTYRLIGAPHYLGGGTIANRAGEPYARSLHNHPHALEVLLFKAGEAVYTIDGVPYEVRPMSAVIYNCGIWHEEKASPYPPQHIHHFTAEGVQLDGLPPNHLIGPDVPAVIPLYDRFPKLEERFADMQACRRHGDGVSSQTADFLLGALLLELLQLIHGSASRRKPASERASVSQIRQYIEENYREELSLDRLAEQVYLNKYYLSHLFKTEVGVSPFHYLMDYRIEVAKRYLAVTAEPVDEIAGLVGYGSVTHFQNLFKRKTGLTPGQFRKKRTEGEQSAGL